MGLVVHAIYHQDSYLAMMAVMPKKKKTRQKEKRTRNLCSNSKKFSLRCAIVENELMKN